MHLSTTNPEDTTWWKRSKAALAATTVAAITAIATGGAIATCAVCPSSALAAGSSEKLEWSIDLDCAQCHPTQAATFEQADGADEDESAAKNVPTAKKGGDAEATGETSATTASEASGNSDDASASGDAGAMTGLEGYAAMHAADFGFECSTCHEDSDKLAKAHSKLNSGKEATRLKKTAVESKVCTACHDLEELAEATEGCTTLTDSEGTTVNPHDLPENDEHASIDCADCHQVHETGKSLSQTAKTACGNCHHAGVYECGTCH